MKIINRTRQLYQQLIQQRKPKESEIEDTIQASEQFKSLIKSQSWKRIEKWIEKQEEGMRQFMEHETQVVSLWSVVKAINLYLKYLMMLNENRAYKKLKTFISTTIQKGEEYARQKSAGKQREK